MGVVGIMTEPTEVRGAHVLLSGAMDTSHPIARIRVERGMTQQELADAAGLHRTTINRLENERTLASLQTLVTLATALQVPVGALIETEGAA